jgi:asparagine synthase (glutamine-hydrolysing)
VDSSNAAKYCTGPAFHLESPEQEHAQLVAEHYGLPLHVVVADVDRVQRAHTHIAATSGEPTMAGHIPYLAAERAAEYCKAAVSANGADELFFGYDWIATNAAGMAAQDARVLRDLRRYRLTKCGSPSWMLYDLEDKRFTLDAHSRWRMLMLYIQYDLNPTLDAAAMCHGLEMRVPFLDHKLVEAALSLPASWHGNKRVLRERLLDAGIPQATVDHTKLGFSMHGAQALRPYMEAAVRGLGREHGLVVDAGATPRDKSYLAASAMGWQRWQQYWNAQEKIQP